jgi:hypothetical protein
MGNKVGDLNLLTAAKVRELEDLIQWKKNFRVVGARMFTNGPTSCAIDVTRAGNDAPPPQPSPAVVLIHLINSPLAVGKYNFARVNPPTADVDDVTDLTASDFGTEEASGPWSLGIALNEDETDSPGPAALDPSTNTKLYFKARVVRTNSDGTPVVAFWGDDPINCTDL